MKRVIVTGGAGFIGSCLIKLLLKKKYIVLNLDKLFFNRTSFSFINFFFVFHQDLVFYKVLW